MKKRRTKAQKYEDYADAYEAIRENRPVKRAHAKDGSIPTHPIVDVPELSEKLVLHDCIEWLHRHRIFCNRMNVGGGTLSMSGHKTYGIVGAGDIIGLLTDGRHFEIECKAGKGGRLSLKQQKRMKNIRENNGIYLVVHSALELEYYFRDLI